MARRLQTTALSFQIINHLKEQNGATMPEISNELEMATSSVHAHLKTLEDEGVVTKEGNEYNLGLLFFTYGEYVKSRKQEYTPGMCLARADFGTLS